MSPIEATRVALEAAAWLMAPLAAALVVAAGLSFALRRAIGDHDALESVIRLVAVGLALALAAPLIAGSITALADWMWGAGLIEAVGRPGR